MNALWSKEWTDTDAEVLAFTIGDDAVLDNRLIPYDIVGTLAHARGLEKIGLLAAKEHDAIRGKLADLYEAWKAGRFHLKPGDEDMHSALERELTAALGDLGKRIHTGRSRNDQVLTALRLFMKESLLTGMKALSDLAGTACREGQQHLGVMMPGYTHLQRAMPATVGFWYASFAESFADTLDSGRALFDRIDRSPLGAAAGFGAPLPLDRELTAKAMGFSRVHINAAAVQNSRGRYEAALANWLVDVGLDVEKLSFDLLLFSSREFGFVRLPGQFTTGSSIMPQKQNPDIIELLRAAPAVQRACRDEIEHLIAKLPSNYHRDFQSTKGPLLRAVEKGRLMMVIANKLMSNLKWNSARLRAACTEELFATHRAVALAREGIPFREAYGLAAKELREGKTADWVTADNDVLKSLGHLGAPGNPGLKEAAARIDALTDWVDATLAELLATWALLLGR
jgi:argininosuccinate lyase